MNTYLMCEVLVSIGKSVYIFNIEITDYLLMDLTKQIVRFCFALKGGTRRAKRAPLEHQPTN